MLRLTLDEGVDPIDGSDNNAVRRTALELLQRTDDGLTDVEIHMRATDELAFLDLCMELGRTPDELAGIGTRTYTALQARGVVKAAQQKMVQKHRGATGIPAGHFG